MLSKDTPRVWELGNVNQFPLAGSATIFQGAAVGDNGLGFARSLVAGDKFLGFSESYVSALSPSSGLPGALEGDTSVRVLSNGFVQLSVTGLKATSLHSPVYASDDSSFTLSGGLNSPLGSVDRVLDNGTAIVAFGGCVATFAASHRLLFAGSHKTAGGAVMEKIALPGLLVSDIAQVTVVALGKTPCLIKAAMPTAGSLHVTFDNDPSSDHALHYIIYRAVA